MLTEIGEAVAVCLGEESRSIWLRGYRPPPRQDLNQFLIMLKPELTGFDGEPATRALARALDVLGAHGIEFGAVRVVSAGYLAEHRVMEEQYGMLFRVSQQGLGAISAAARDRLHDAFPFAAAAPDRVLGGHQFLASVPELTPFALDLVTRNVSVVKLGSGTYGIEVILDGDRFVVLNPFHPLQLAHFTSPGRAVVLLECTSSRALSELRRSAIGATDPRDAVPGSLKRILLDEQHDLALSAICTRRNAVHMSPGPVEGMVGVRRYFSTPEAEIPVEQTAFGARLVAAGHSAEAIAKLSEDPEVEVGELRGPLFEVTEDLNWDEALTVTSEVLEEVGP